ncbi:MAG: hypothetical protein JNL11_19045 [Bdellovibrionaceae bacterium]|nr:hypothetical protein [Pseudobdellovibrionaceae bacterium]
MNDRANVLNPAEEFATILAENPKELNQAEVNRGNNVLMIYNDENFGSRFEDLKSLKLSVVKMAIEDISGRAQILSSNTIGVVFLENKLQTFLSPFGSNTSGTVVYKIGIKNTIAFQKWRQGESSDISQEDINSAVYRLVYEWSKLLK